MFHLRGYQEEAVEKAVDFLENSVKYGALEVLPTGSGKSLVIANIAKRLNDHVLVFQPSKEILEQNFNKFLSYGESASIYSASFNSKEISPVTFATIGSVRKKPEIFQHFNYVIVDECVPGDVDVLTERGYIKFEDLKEIDKVAQWDDGKIDFVKPSEIIKIDYDGEMYNFHVKKDVNLLMSPNHSNVFIKNGKRVDVLAKNTKAFNWFTKIPVSGESSLPYDELSAIERLYIAIQADGSLHHTNKSCKIFEFSLAKLRKIRRLDYLCELANIKIHETKPNKRKRRFFIKMPLNATKDIRNHIKFPMSYEKAKDVIDEMKNWDGSRINKGMYYFSSTEKTQSDFYASVAVLAGHRAVQKVQKDYRKESYKDVHRVFIKLNNIYDDTQRCSISKTSFKGDLYCVRVPSKAFVIRKDGFTFVTGNCHFVNPKQGMYKEFLEKVGNKVLGLTATPYRLSTDGFGGSILKFLTRTRPRVFEKLIYYVQNGDLFDQNYLAKLEYFPIEKFQTARLKLNSTGADFTDRSVRQHMKEIDFNDLLFRTVRRLLQIRKSVLVFTRFVEEADELSRKFLGESEIVEANTKKSERDRIIGDFKSGKIRVVCNVGILTTGFDHPELDTVVIARPTRSLALYYQMIGRSIRIHPEKESSYVVDLCDNFRRFGKVEELEIARERPNKDLWIIKNPRKQLTNIYFN